MFVDTIRLTRVRSVSSSRVLVVELSPTDPLGRLGEWLSETGVEFDVVTDARPLATYGGLVVLGGPQSANDGELAPFRQLLRDAITAELPTLGICLGAQLLAVAHGGRVEPNPEGPEIGAQLIAKRGAAATDPLFGPLPITPDVLQWHFDAVTALPAGAIHLASSPLCEHQAFRLGRLAWGVQFHIETTPQMVRDWAAKYADVLDGYDLDRTLSRAIAVHDDIAEVWQPFVAAFADIVRDPAAVSAPRGVPTSTAAPVTDPAAIRAALAAEAHAARATLPTPTLRPPHDE
jgi:GMP synthase-like glutamine amidotransferase